MRARTQNPPKSVPCSEPDATRPTCGRCREPFPPQLCSSLVPETVALNPRSSQLLIRRQRTLPLCSPKLKPHRFSPRHSGGVSVPVLTRSYLFHRFCLIKGTFCKRRVGSRGAGKGNTQQDCPPTPPPTPARAADLPWSSPLPRRRSGASRWALEGKKSERQWEKRPLVSEEKRRRQIEEGQRREEAGAAFTASS